MPWNDNANPGPWGSPPSGGDGDRRDPPRRPFGGGGRGPNFDPGLGQFGERLRRMLSGPGGAPRRNVILGVLAAAFALWAASGIYMVQPSEKGVVLTFGRFSGISDPGLRYHLPAPIAHVEKVAVTSLKKTDVGGATEPEALAESLMLTGDEQIIDIDYSVIWRVSDPQRYIFATRDPEQAVKAVAESAMREVVGRTALQPILSTGRGVVQLQTAEIMQRTLEAWGAGVSIVEVQIRSANPPTQVVEAFRDVQSAEQDSDSRVNEANTYRNRVVNEARGDAAKIIQGAEAYREAAVREAQGEAARFNQLVTEYRRAPGVTRDRLYIETMQRVLQNSNKVIVDAKGASAPIILPPDAFRPRNPAQAPAPQPQPEPPQLPSRESRQ